MNKGLLFTGLGVIIVGVGFYISEQIKLVKAICYKITDYKAKKVSIDDTEFDVNLEISNSSNKFSVKVISVDVDIYVNGVLSSKAMSKIDFIVEPSSVSNVPLLVKFSPKNILSNLGSILSAMSSIDEMQVVLKGKITAQKGVVPLFIPFSFATTIKELRTNSTESTC